MMGGHSEKIVVVAPSWLGDAVMSLPALGALSASGASLAVMSRPYTARVYMGIDGVDEVVVPGGERRSARVVAWARALRAIGPDAAVILPPSFSSALAPWVARVPVRAGYDADARGPLLTDSLPTPPRASEHLSQSYRRLSARVLDRLGIPHGTVAAAPAIRVFDADRRAASTLCASRGVDGDYALVVPGAAYGPAKSWHAERFLHLVAGLSRDMPVLVAGGARERALCERVAGTTPGAHNVAGATTLGGFFALAAGARVLVANDSGTPHAAASLGVPAVVLFGSTSPEWTRPLGERVTVLRHPVHCSPCFRRDCPTQLECFAAISTDEVLEAARRAARLGSKKGVA